MSLIAGPAGRTLSRTDRGRAYAAIFAGVAASTTGFLASNTVNGLVAEDLTGTAVWSGVPAAATVLGTAAGATLLAAVVRRVGPRAGLLLGYILATAAVATAAYAILAGSFALFVAALFVFGVGFGSNRLARYVAAELYPAEQRASVIGWIVWAATIGAVAGPVLLAPSRAFAEQLNLNGLIGPYLVCILACAVAAATMQLAPTAMDRPFSSDTRNPSLVPMARLLRHPGVSLALVSMVSGQFVMVLLMTMTPVHIRHEGHGLGAIGLVISAHTLGMFALSPITGALADRFGRVPVLVASVVVLVAACVVGVVASEGSYAMMILALFLLGFGWNLGFVSGSALITESVASADRVRLQGMGDTLIWGSGALASIGSGWLLGYAGFAMLSVAGAVLSLAPVWPLIRFARMQGPSRV